jgi:hypothetical protein
VVVAWDAVLGSSEAQGDLACRQGVKCGLLGCSTRKKRGTDGI